jgi:hypothetical protein
MAGSRLLGQGLAPVNPDLVDSHASSSSRLILPSCSQPT